MAPPQPPSPTAEDLRRSESFEDLTFVGLDLTGADLGGKVFANCTFRNSKLAESRWERARLEDCVLDGCDLRKATFPRARDLLLDPASNQIKGAAIPPESAFLLARSFGFKLTED